MRHSRSIWTTLATSLLAAAVVMPAVAQSPEPSGPSNAALPAPFTMTIVFGDEVRQGTVVSAEGVITSRGYGHNPTLIETSDPRLDGRVTIAFDSDEYRTPDGASYVYGTGTWRIVTPDGAWQGTYPIVATDEYSSVVTVALAGEGAYEGQTAVWEQPIAGDRWDIRGVIFPTPPIDAPIAAP